MTYKELIDRQQKEYNAFPIGACFNQKQFQEMMAKWGITVNDTKKILSLGGGSYIRLTDAKAYNEMLLRFAKEKDEAIAADKTGDGFIYEMFLYELANHEYCITYDIDEVLDAVGLRAEDIAKDKRLQHGLKKAQKEYLKNSEDY